MEGYGPLARRAFGTSHRTSHDQRPRTASPGRAKPAPEISAGPFRPDAERYRPSDRRRPSRRSRFALMTYGRRIVRDGTCTRGKTHKTRQSGLFRSKATLCANCRMCIAAPLHRRAPLNKAHKDRRRQAVRQPEAAPSSTMRQDGQNARTFRRVNQRKPFLSGRSGPTSAPCKTSHPSPGRIMGGRQGGPAPS